MKEASQYLSRHCIYMCVCTHIYMHVYVSYMCTYTYMHMYIYLATLRSAFRAHPFGYLPRTVLIEPVVEKWKARLWSQPNDAEKLSSLGLSWEVLPCIS